MSETFISKITAKSQTVIPLAVRNALNLKPGDMIRYRVRGKKIELEKLNMEGPADDPFTAFTEWASPSDDDAYRDL